MSGDLRTVEPIRAPDITPADAGARPELVWLPIESLFINGEYQRSLSEKSITAIRRIVRNFDWARLKALSCVKIGAGKYEVIDGQHTAIAAATHGGVRELPCLVTGEKPVEGRAADFVGLNRDRVSMTPQQIFFAEVAAKDEIACDVLQGVNAAGGQILKFPPAFGRFKQGDVMCLVALKSLAAKGGVAYVKRVVSIGIDAKLAPIMAPTVKAIEMFVWGKFADSGVSDQNIVDVYRTYTQEALVQEARKYARDRKVTSAVALCEIIRGKL